MLNKTKDKAKITANSKKSTDKMTKDRSEREAKQSLRKLAGLLKKRQAIIITIILMTGLGAIIILMSNIFDHANDTSGDLDLDTNVTFDQKTIEQIIELDKVNDQVPAIDNSGGRINPFSDR